MATKNPLTLTAYPTPGKDVKEITYDILDHFLQRFGATGENRKGV